MDGKGLSTFTTSATYSRRDGMKVTMLSIMAGPQGVAHPGTVLEVSDKLGQELIDGRNARPYDPVLDRKARQHGFQQAKE
jgi:hypothetical protein